MRVRGEKSVLCLNGGVNLVTDHLQFRQNESISGHARVIFKPHTPESKLISRKAVGWDLRKFFGLIYDGSKNSPWTLANKTHDKN